MNKANRSRSSGDVVEGSISKNLKQRVFLYLQVKSVKYNFDYIPSSSSEIEVEHNYNTITTLSDHYMPRNIIRIDQLDMVKPTFSVTIEQDSLENITIFSDSPILLTLYVLANKKSNIFEALGVNNTDEEEIRIPVAQGHIDIIECFRNKRTRSTVTVFLYPLRNYSRQILTCKTEWEIYSLHPLLKTINISNFLFITLESLYNFDEEIMADCQDLGANIFFTSKTANENTDFDKIFICNFKTFSKSIISQQRLTKSWESLKNYNFGNIDCMGISSEYSKININNIFSNLLSTEDVDFNFRSIDINENCALICNSMHRYVLTNDMQKTLADALSRNFCHIILEIYSGTDTTNIILQGYIDLSVFMYPYVNNCSFAIELKPPSKISANQSPTNKRSKDRNAKRKTRNFPDQQIKEDPIPFAIVQICLYTPITDLCRDIGEIYNQKLKHNQFSQHTAKSTSNAQIILRSNCEKYYRSFDDLILEIIEYMVYNNFGTMKDDREFFSNQLSNVNNKIMKIVACDFNIRTPTKTNIQFKNLMTTVYSDLTSRIHDSLIKCTQIGKEDCVLSMTNKNFIIQNMSLAKSMYEIGNIELANVFMNTLRLKFPNNAILKFYLLLYDIERQNFAEAQIYLKSSLYKKDTEGELFEDLIKMYINYKLQKEYSELNQAEENLIQALTDYVKSHKPTCLTGFILLYCLYKKYKYQSGMAYCRWRYENLYDSKFVKPEFIPKSRWEIYMPHKIFLKSLKGQNFVKVYLKLVRLGLYDFAQCVFHEVADECMEIERYFFSSTFLILTNQLQDNWSIKSFSLDKLTNSIHLRATLSLVNGNLEYFRNSNNQASIKHYQDIVDVKELDDHAFYQLGLLRFAYKKMNDEKYKEAGKVFLSLCNHKTRRIIAEIGRGKACYHMGQLDEAEKYFALSTEHGIHIASTWEYLALINLRNGNNFKALECWKYARLNNNIEEHENIVNELKKTNYNDICLFVDIPDEI